MVRAIYGGTFDVLTNGHLFVIREAAPLFDELVVAVAENPLKTPLFEAAVRRRVLEEATNGTPNVRIISFADEYLAAFAKKAGTPYLVRGLRDAADFEYERTMAHMNGAIAGARTVFLPAPRELSHVSSSLVKSLVGPRGWERVVAPLVPDATIIRLLGRRHGWVRDALVAAGARLPDFDCFWRDALLPYFGVERAYHSWTHISAGLDELERIRGERNAAALALAWLYHDAVYDVFRDDNEERSVTRMEEALAAFLPADLMHNARRMILATKTHTTAHADDAVLIDVDLTILGAPEEEFDAYEDGIAAEYSRRYAPDAFAEGRGIWVMAFLAAHSERIYLTDEFEARYGKQARKNLRHSLAKHTP